MSDAGDCLLTRMQHFGVAPSGSLDYEARVRALPKLKACDRPVVSSSPYPVSYLVGHLASPCLCLCPHPTTSIAQDTEHVKGLSVKVASMFGAWYRPGLVTT